ncbi:DUF2274 domain-containing protein [Bradyrhizobium sp.]|uniref:DUF2274 domain-containing protein n=1 Tax=Bradyrhizobium sp. TaxID=376 RepID=UPI002617FB6B|nr:DUF2274 domain-containing protein [Bradyrhizobium sp.]
MTKLKLVPVVTEKPVRITFELPAEINRDLRSYAELMKRQNELQIDDPVNLIAPMLKQFMATDRTFRKLRRQLSQEKAG